jgi:hypothetical protein
VLMSEGTAISEGTSENVRDSARSVKFAGIPGPSADVVARSYSKSVGSGSGLET